MPLIQPPRDALQIDVVFVERAVGHPLLGPNLWTNLDQVGAVIGAEEREAVKRLGLQIGNAGATPCPALERLLENTVDPIDAGASKKSGLRTYCVRPFEEAPIETNSAAECTVNVPTLTETKPKSYKNFASVLRLANHRMNDGWARLEFTPEIHYGEKRMRAVSSKLEGKSAWQPRISQEIDALLAHRFSVALHVGEMVVITAAPDRPLSFGHQSFIHTDSGKGPLQRLLIVRLSNMARIDPIYAPPNRDTPRLAESSLAEQGLPGRK